MSGAADDYDEEQRKDCTCFLASITYLRSLGTCGSRAGGAHMRGMP